MIIKKIFSFVLVLFLFLVGFVNAADINIVTYNIPMLVVNENKGVFIELAKEIAKRANVSISIKIQPIKRALDSFNNKKFDVLFPALPSYFAKNSQYERTEPIFQKRDFIFTLKTKPILTTIKELEGKQVGIVFAAPYAHALVSNTKIHFQRVQRDRVNVKKLLIGRIDATVVEEKSALSAFMSENALDKIHYNPKKPVTIQDAFFAFQAITKGKKYASKFSKALIEMKKDGTFAAIMPKIPK